MRIILASGSPRRKELLEQAGYIFDIEVSDADENIETGLPETLVEELSFRKASAVAKHYTEKKIDADVENGEDFIIIGADTIVVLDKKILGKPDGEAGAKKMLRSLSGKTHQVYTGVSLVLIKNNTRSISKSFHVCTDVTMRELSDQEICAYVATGEPFDKAGAYGIQGKAAVFISGICGDYYNVVGLPICELSKQMERLFREEA